MAGLDSLGGVGGLMPDNSQLDPSGLGALLNNPMARSALLGFSLQALTPSWGGGLAQLGQALGAGAGSAQGTAEAMEKEGVRQAESAQRAALERETIAGREKVADIGGESRVQAAYLRGVEAAKIRSLSQAPASLILKYREEARKVIDSTLGDLGMSDQDKFALIEQKANELYQADVDRGRIAQPGAAGAVGSPGTSANAPGTATESPAGGTAPPAKPAAGAKGGPNTPSPETTPDIYKMMEHPTMGAQFKQKMETPEGQAEILKLNPSLKPQIDNYNMHKSFSQFAPHKLLQDLFTKTPALTQGQDFKR